MNQKIRQQHSIDILFLVVVFILFTFSGVTFFILAANFYQSTITKGEENDNARVAIAYVREVLHQNDATDGIAISEFEGIQCLSIPQEENYVLYLYYYDGMLRELYVKSGATVMPEDGQSIMELQSFSVKEKGSNLFLIECEDCFGNARQVLISQKSGERGM